MMVSNSDNDSWLFVEASGQSMWPALRSQSRVLIRKVPLAILRRGDIITYRDSAALVCHRVIARKHNGNFLIRGDAVKGRADEIPETRVLGKVVAIHYKGRIYNLESLFWRFLGVLISRGSLMADQFWRLAKRRKYNI
jgi:signal peptidase I